MKNESDKSLNSSIQDELRKFNLPLVIDDNLINRHIKENKKHPKSMSKFRKQKEIIFDNEKEEISESS
jgi:hypothetical protein